VLAVAVLHAAKNITAQNTSPPAMPSRDSWPAVARWLAAPMNGTSTVAITTLAAELNTVR
jgi:hypothetical protein